MVKPEAAQSGVLQAILDLHASGKFTSLLTGLDDSVRPKFGALNLPIASEPVFGVQPEPQAPIGSYARSSRDRNERLREFDDALRAWARRFRLTRDLTKTGECLPWVLDFARARCENGSFTIPLGPRRGKRMQPPWGSVIPAPGPNEKLPAWVARIRPLFMELRRAAQERQRSRSYPDPANRTTDHYKWFVLKVCGGLTPGKILEVLEMRRRDESTVRKGVASV